MSIPHPARGPMRFLCLAAMAMAALLSTACAVPLGPGYTVEKQQLDVRYVPGQPSHLEVRASYTLKNTGNTDLTFIEATLPDEKEAGRSGLRVLVDGAEVVTQNAAADKAPRKWRIPFVSPWPQKQKRAMVVEYQLKTPIGSSTAGESFYLSTSGWYPALQPPKGLFSKGGERPEKWDLIVRVPDGFLVHASGKSKGAKRRAGEAEHRFRQSPDDFNPFIVAGRYRQQRVTAHGVEVNFWTVAGLPESGVTVTGQRIAASVRTLDNTFGSSKKSRSVWLVEGDFPSGSIDFPFFTSGASLPEVVLLNGYLFEGSLERTGFPVAAEMLLARTWSKEVASFSPEADFLYSVMLDEYFWLVTAEARGEGERVNPPERIPSLLRQYEEKRGQNPEKPLTSITSQDDSRTLELGGQRAGLFFDALDDKCGKDAVRKALRRMFQSMRGETVGVGDLRSALEAETGQDLAEFFRVWLNQPGIPDDFRKKYSKAAEKGK